MHVHGDDGAVDVRYARAHVSHHRGDLARRRVAHRIRQIHRGGAGGDDGLDDAAHVVEIRARGVFERELHVLAAPARIFHRFHRPLERLLARHAQLVLQMQVARGEERVDARTHRALHRLVGRVDILLERPAERRHDRRLHRLGNAPDALEIARRGDGEARLEHVHAQPFELLRHAHLLLDVHRVARRLFAVAQRRIEYPHLVCHFSLCSFRNDKCGSAYQKRGRIVEVAMSLWFQNVRTHSAPAPAGRISRM